MRYLNLDHLCRCIETLQQSLRLYQNAEPDGIEQEVFRNDTAHDYGEVFAWETLTLMPDFLADVSRLADRLDAKLGKEVT